MIDTIRFKTQLSSHNIRVDKWNISITDDGEIFYQTFIKTVRIAYYPSTKSLLICGRLVGVYSFDRISNFDDLFSDRWELINFFSEFNEMLNELLIGIKIDIQKLPITRIDYCFNIYTDKVSEYIELFNMCYKLNANGKFSKYINHADYHDLDKKSSFYLKTKGDYKNNTRKGYVINFYNKQNQLINKRAKQIEKRGFSNISLEQIKSSKNILRLEIQVGYNLLKKICNDYNITPDKKNLYNLFDINIAKYIFNYKIKYLFTLCDFYSYPKVKEILIGNGYKKCSKIFDYILKISHCRNYKVSKRYTDILVQNGIYPYIFIPRKWNIDKLDNPYKLIKRKISDSKLENFRLKKGEIAYAK